MPENMHAMTVPCDLEKTTRLVRVYYIFSAPAN